MTAFHKADRAPQSSGAAAVLAAGLACLLGRLLSDETARAAAYPFDYRERHPITLKEGQHTVEIFLGRNRGGLSPNQRADVLSFAQQWRHEATSGIIIDVPHGGPTDRAAADSLREIHSILAASGVPRNAVYMRSYRPSETSLASIKINYTKLVAHAGPCGLWPSDLGPAPDIAYNDNRPTGISAAPRSAISPPWSITRPTWCSRAARRRPMRRAARLPWTSGARATIQSGTYTGYDTGKISDLGK